MLLGLVLLLVLVSSMLLVFGVAHLRRPSTAQIDLAALAATQSVPQKSYFERGIRPRSERFAKTIPFLKGLITPMNIEERITYAGSPLELTSDLFYGMQLFAGLAAALFGVPLGLIVTHTFQGGLIVALVLAIAGAFYPILWLNSKIQKRQFEITVAVPDALDLLATSMEAGLGFDIALQHVTTRTQGPLTEELSRLLKELHMGTPRAECFRHIYNRNSSKELRTLIGALLQAHELGTPISQTLQDQAEEMRVQRIQRAREAGAQASPKISLVTTMLIAPAVMCMFLAVLAYHLWTSIQPFLSGFTGGP